MNCKFFDCENPSRTKGLCPTHYAQQLLGSQPQSSDWSEHPPCAVSHCDIPATTRAEGSYCRAHYQLAYRGVDPETRRAPKNGNLKTDKTCWVAECARRVDSNGLCNYHARRARGGKLEVPEELGVKLNGPCSFEGCDRPYISKGLCHSHYCQLQEGRQLKELREYGKYVKGDHVCGVPSCKKAAISMGFCGNHKSLQIQYGLTVEEFVEVWTDPRCENPGCSNITRLHMDHDHDTGKYRGLLCSGCNSALGFLKEDTARMEGLAVYKQLHS
jgi:hypothetical protein